MNNKLLGDVRNPNPKIFKRVMGMGTQTSLKECVNCGETFIGVPIQIHCTTCAVSFNCGDMQSFARRRNITGALRVVGGNKELDMGRNKKKNKHKQASHIRNINKPKLRIFVVGDAVNYTSWIDNCIITQNLERAELVMFTGGSDVDPELYGEQAGNRTHIQYSRDVEEMKIFKEAKALGKKMIGICRGAQFLCVAAGGKLIQHCENHAIAGQHDCVDSEGDEYKMTSTHHQMMYPFNLESGKDYLMIAYSQEKLSETYLNGNNEEIDVPKSFVEPEVVVFPKIDALAIQGHPERMGHRSDGVKYCQDYLRNFLAMKLDTVDEVKQEKVEV